MVAFHYAARSDIGLGRYKNNQDSGYAGTNLLVVADGMGGYAGGDVASSLAIGNLIGLDADAPGAADVGSRTTSVAVGATESGPRRSTVTAGAPLAVVCSRGCGRYAQADTRHRRAQQDQG